MSQVISDKVSKKVGFSPINELIKNFMNVSLYEIVKNNSETRFLSNAKKYCYRLDYKHLALGYAEARDNFGDAIVAAHTDAYVKQQMHSVSGEQGDLCYYGYSPENLREFLNLNSQLHFTFLPLTVHSVDSANGTRHDMLIIFDNRTKLVYWFDGRNREDYLALGQHLPKNAMDVLFINLFGNLKLGYNYEPSPSWQIQGTLHSYGSIGTLDFVLSTAWCYNMLLSLNEYDNPTGYLSILDTLSETDRFHLVYSSMLSVIGAQEYHPVVPKTSQVNLVADAVKIADQDPDALPTLPHTTTEVAPLAVTQVAVTQPASGTTTSATASTTASQRQNVARQLVFDTPRVIGNQEVKTAIENEAQALRQRHTTGYTRIYGDNSINGGTSAADVHLQNVPSKPMAVVTDYDRQNKSKDNEKCITM